MKKRLSLWLVACLVALLPLSASAYVVESNNTTDYIKKVVMRSTIICSWYYSTFTCEHYLSPGQSMAYYDYSWEDGAGMCYYYFSVDSITWISLGNSYTVSLNGPSSLCIGCTATFAASVSPSGSNPTLYWFRDGAYLGQAGATISLTLNVAGNTTVSVSDSQTWGAPGSKTASVTVNVIAKGSPGNGVTLGSFAVVHPPISSAFIVDAGSNTLGLTQANRAYSTYCNCTCTGYVLESGLLINVYQYCYDSRINNAADITAVSNAEAQHVALYEQFAATVANQYNSLTRATATQDDCHNLSTAFINYRDQEYTAMLLNQAALDDPNTGPHRQLGNTIRSHGGWGP